MRDEKLPDLGKDATGNIKPGVLFRIFSLEFLLIFLLKFY